MSETPEIREWDSQTPPAAQRTRRRGLARIAAAWSAAGPGRRLLIAGGAVSFLAGIVLLVIGIASVTGGDSAPPKGPAVVDLGEDDSFLDTQPRGPTATPSPTGPTPTPAPPLGESPYQIVIEKIGVDAPVRTYGLDANQVPEVPVGDDAREVVAWYNWSAKPGTGGNAVFAGHVTWFGQAVFYSLTSVAPGDLIRLRNDQGTELVYTVSSVFSVDANDPDARTVMHGTETDVLTIITCDGTYTDTDDPVYGGEYSSRLVVRADLDQVIVAESPQAPASGG